MKIISFDIGIRNMAYCIMCLDEHGRLVIQDWNILNLLEKEEPNVFCNCILGNKPKKSKKLQNEVVSDNSIIANNICNKKAKYQKEGSYFCEMHAKSNIQWLIPKKCYSPTSLKKQRVEELLKICGEFSIVTTQENGQKLIKKTILEKMDSFFETKCYDPIIPKKEQNASTLDLITIGRNMKVRLDLVNNLDEITHVIMENQISPIASRMKTIQGMLAQYFIMKFDGPASRALSIEFVSSSNKLKGLDTEAKTNESNSAYKQHKIDGVYHCLKFLGQNPALKSWETQWENPVFAKKKDDLADCFLQGIWYLKNRNIIKTDSYTIM